MGLHLGPASANFSGTVDSVHAKATPEPKLKVVGELAEDRWSPVRLGCVGLSSGREAVWACSTNLKNPVQVWCGDPSPARLFLPVTLPVFGGRLVPR